MHRVYSLLSVCMYCATVLLMMGLLVGTASAVPVQGFYQDISGNCDDHGTRVFGHELGDAAVFPPNEALLISSTHGIDLTQTSCVGDDGIANDWRVRITNISNLSYHDLFFVSDLGFGVGNYDGFTEDSTFVGFTQSLRIDGTVTPGVNNSLVLETGIVDEILQPGETWEFLIVNFTGGQPVFDSVGLFSASSFNLFAPSSNASILARIVPEPSSMALLALGAVAIGARNRKREGVSL